MRTSFVFLASVVALTGCRPEFTSVEEACQDSALGSGKASDNAISAVTRGNCYRRLVGQAPARVDMDFSNASRAHARYVDQNGFFRSETTGAQESPENPGYTGEWPWDRLAAQGYDAVDQNDGTVMYWSLPLPSVGTVTNEVDVWMDHWITRQILLQPGVVDSGYGRSGDVSVYENVSEFPSNDRVDSPFVYPADGQSGLPISIVNGFAGEVVPESSVVGYPVTITVSSASLGSDAFDENPYGLVLLEQQILDPDNNRVEVIEIQPEASGQPMPNTVALIPREPLVPNTEYRVFARVSWVDGIKNIEATFTTGTNGVEVSDDGELDEESARIAAYQAGLTLQRSILSPRSPNLPQ
ncbi:MAG: hypothetical protein ACJAZO_001822 [Myxococcota bacterium]|jgi:hypothetical protein